MSDKPVRVKLKDGTYSQLVLPMEEDVGSIVIGDGPGACGLAWCKYHKAWCRLWTTPHEIVQPNERWPAPENEDECED